MRQFSVYSCVTIAAICVIALQGSDLRAAPEDISGKPGAGEPFHWDKNFKFRDPPQVQIEQSDFVFTPDVRISWQAEPPPPEQLQKWTEELLAEKVQLDARARELHRHAEEIERARRELEEARHRLEVDRVALRRQFGHEPEHDDHDEHRPQHGPHHGEELMHHLRLLRGMAEHLADPHAAAMLGITFAREELEPEQRIKVMRSVLEEVDQPPAVRNAAMLVLIHTLNDLGHEGDVQKLLTQFIIENANRAK